MLGSFFFTDDTSSELMLAAKMLSIYPTSKHKKVVYVLFLSFLLLNEDCNWISAFNTSVAGRRFFWWFLVDAHSR
jgi:hypothetical protein